MRDFPSCFGENGIQIADSSTTTKNSQHPVTCLYRAQLRGRPCVITIAWSKTLMGQGFTVAIDDSASRFLCKAEIKPWLFSKRKGSKSLETGDAKVDVFWDLSAAKFGTGSEPLECFYVAVVFDLEMALLLGDLTTEAFHKIRAKPPPSSSSSNPILIAKKEHIFGKRIFCTKAEFCGNGKVHEIVIECEMVGLKDPWMEIRVDRKRVVEVKRLAWKFRGNQTIVVDGIPVEVFWDVHNWLFGAPVGNAVFMFQSCLVGEKLLPWFSSSSSSQGLGFSLVLYAWKND